MDKKYFRTGVCALATVMMLCSCGGKAETGSEEETSGSGTVTAETLPASDMSLEDSPADLSSRESSGSEDSSEDTKTAKSTKTSDSYESAADTQTSQPAVTTTGKAGNSAADTTKTTTAATAKKTSKTTEKTPSQDDDEKLTTDMLTKALKGVTVSLDGDNIVEKGKVGGLDYSLTIDREKWDGYTTLDQMVELSRLFWQSYPKMYERFADITNAPRDVILAVEDEGYPIAEAGGNFVHIHDQWLFDNPEDYDCITHELGHIAQDGISWEDDRLEFSYLTELFVDCLRYEYAMDNGYYNDCNWTLHTIDGEYERGRSVRFLVWLDYFYSTEDVDIMRNICTICYNGVYATEDWAQAWAEIFECTALEGMDIEDVWEMYRDSDFASVSAEAEKGETSELLKKYDVRGRFQ